MKNVSLISNTVTGLHINNKSQDIESISTIHEALPTKKVSLSSTTTIINNTDDHRTVLAHHIYHASIKHTFIRFIRETPV